MGVVVAESFCLRVCRGDIQQQESGRRTGCSCVSAQAARLQRRDPSGRGGRYHSSADSHAPERRAGRMRRASWTTPSPKPRGGWGTTAAEGGEGVSFIEGGRVRGSLRYQATTLTQNAFVIFIFFRHWCYSKLGPAVAGVIHFTLLEKSN